MDTQEEIECWESSATNGTKLVVVKEGSKILIYYLYATTTVITKDVSDFVSLKHSFGRALRQEGFIPMKTNEAMALITAYHL